MSYIVASIALVLVIWIAAAIRRTILWRRGLSNIDLDGVRIWLDRLINTRKPNAYLIFEEMSPSKRFVQFRRDVGSAGATLTCHFPNAPWSTVYVPRLEQVLDAQGIPYSRMSVPSGDPVTGFVSIENLDVASAILLVEKVFLDVFESPSVNVRLWGQHVSGTVTDPSQRHQGPALRIRS